MKTLYEVINFTGSNGTSIGVEIDYRHKEISLVDINENGTRHYKKKNWVFGGRAISFMHGWNTIMKDMQEAVEFGQSRLQAYLDDETEEFAKDMVEFGLHVDIQK
jgi:hypothetical protein